MLKKLARSASLVALGTGLGQGVTLLVTPILSRVHSPADFGALALIISLGNLAVAAACLRYDLAIPAAPDGHARPLLRVALLSAVLIAFTSMLACMTAVGLSATLTSPFNQPLAIFFCVLLAGGMQAALGWATRLHAFGRVALTRFGQGGAFAVLGLVPAIGLVWAYVVSLAAGGIALCARTASPRSKDEPLLQVAREYRKFPLVSLPGALFDVVGYSLCVWIISSNYGVADAGQYSQIQRLIGAPLMLIGMSLGQVLLRYSADVTHDPAGLKTLFYRLLKMLGGLGMVVVLATAAVGEPVLRLFLGPQWNVDVLFIVPIAVAVAVRACASPLSNILVTLRRFDLALLWQVTYFVSAGVTFYIASTQLRFSEFVFVYAVHELIHYSGYLYLIRSAIKKSCVAFSD